ncbi:Holliday junction resolvase RuvX [Cellulomonas citrea]|uniref:Holliday junction resolvase RuvX n=1 Tax=Cellulomonas citrea TaxID=1909423 RepID=UPI001359F6EF|nr:Holliday junction resolvase RuvX [Cellulomonas citrea]
MLDAEPGPQMRHVRLGVDVGTVRVGLACSDPDGLLATPVATLERPRSIDLIVHEVRERGAGCVYVGLPRHLSGREGASASAVRAYADQLALAVTPVMVRLVDERLSTVSAHQALRSAGRSTKKHRAVVDQAAAVVILQDALDAERASGSRPGEVVETDPPRRRTGRGSAQEVSDDTGVTPT